MAINRMKQLARNYTYEPKRGVEGDPAPEPLRDQVRELPLRITGCRVFVAVDADGEIRAVGLMEQGGDRKRLAAQLYAEMDTASTAPILKAV